MNNKINMDLECDLASSLNSKDKISGSTSKMMCTNGSTTEENSELIISNKPLDVEQSQPDQNMEISDTESTVTIGEISADEYYDEIIVGKQPVVHEELYGSDQNEQSGSSNNRFVLHYFNVGENIDGEDLIMNDISLAVPTITNERSHNRQHTHEQSTRRRGRRSLVHTLKNTVCYRPACNNLVMPLGRPRNKRRAAAVEAASIISRTGTRKMREITTVIYSCGHLEKMCGTSLNHIGIKTPMIMKKCRLLDQRLMKTTYYLLKLPAALTVDNILNDYRRKANLCTDDAINMALVIIAFNQTLPAWCLYFIEKLQYDEMTIRYPDRQPAQLYGLAHLLRFIACLPRLYHRMKNTNNELNLRFTEFMNKFLDYLVEENLCVDIKKDYERVLPEYHRLTYW